jgi:hypothetical protein
MENKDLVRDLTYTKQMASDLATIIEEKDRDQTQYSGNDGSPPQGNRGGIPNHDSSGLNDTVNTEMSMLQHEQAPHHPEGMIQSMRPISHTSEMGPPEAMLTMGDPNNLEDSMKEYNDSMPKTTQPTTPPDWLKPIKTSGSDTSGFM